MIYLGLKINAQTARPPTYGNIIPSATLLKFTTNQATE